MVNNCVIDIQFMYFWQCSNCFYVVVGQIVVGIYFQFEVGGVGGCFGNMFQFSGLFGVGFGIGIVVGVDFDIGCVNVCCCFDLCFICIDKQGDQDVGICQVLIGIVYFVVLFGYVQFVFGSDFLMFFWYQVVEVWFGFVGDCQYFFGDCYFKIYLGVQCFVQDMYIVIGNMVMVFVQMYGDVVSVGLFGNESCLNWIWVSGVVGVM